MTFEDVLENNAIRSMLLEEHKKALQSNPEYAQAYQIATSYLLMDQTEIMYELLGSAQPLKLANQWIEDNYL